MMRHPMLRIALVAGLLFFVGVARAEDSFGQHVERALTLSQNDQYSLALKELEAAYAMKQPQSLLYSLGLAHRRLGHAKEALDFYLRFLAAESDPSPEMKEQVEREVRELRKLVVPGDTRVLPLDPGFVGEPVRYETKRDRGLIAVGVALLASGYAGAVIAGSLLLPEKGQPGGAAAGTLLVPVLGPVISGFIYLSAPWSLPWILVDAAAQAAGLALIVIGARSSRKVPVYSRAQLTPYAASGSLGLKLSFRF
jgi:hypothetical protein